jgi:argininosuccinate lyase
MQSSPLLHDEASAFPFVAKGASVAFLSPLAVDRRLAAADIAGTIAHVASLRLARLLTRQEAKQLVAALKSCLAEIDSGAFPWREDLEDVHTNIESRLLELAGGVGGKVHAARSRNDQVALDARLYVRQSIESLLKGIAKLQGRLLAHAKERADVVAPGYTHLQRAQPVLLGHLLLAHFWRLARDADRLHDAFGRANVCPAGAAAVAGTSLPIDPAGTASLLGFDRVFANSVDATTDRDFFVEVTSALALLAVHLSGLCEDLLLWSTKEFGFATFAEVHTSGSSLLPNKRNPDLVELVRGRTGAVIGDLVALLAVLKALPLGYHRDLQADKASAFHAIDTVEGSLTILSEVLAGLEFHPEAMASTLGPAESAVLLVEHLVAKGVPYREAYGIVRSNLPAILEAPPGDARASALRKASPLLDGAAAGLLTPQGAVGAIVSPGGTGPVQLAAQIREAEAALGREAYHLNLIAKKNRRIAGVLSGEVAL